MQALMNESELSDLKNPGKPSAKSLKRSQRWMEYEKHLRMPISWSEFPMEYIKELQSRKKAQKYPWNSLGWSTYPYAPDGRYDPARDERDRDRASNVPVFHYGILLSGKEIKLYGEHFYKYQAKAAGVDYDGYPLPDNFIPIINHLNSKLGRLREELEFINGQPVCEPYGEQEICSLVCTAKPDTWTSEEKLEAAFTMLRDELQLSADRKPMWYFDRDFFGPHNTHYTKFDVDRVVGSELLEHLPKDVQAVICAGMGTEVKRSSN